MICTIGQCGDTIATWGQSSLMKAKIRALMESEQVNNRQAHGQDLCRIWHVIWVWFRAGQKEQVLGSTNPGRGRYLEPGAMQSRSSRADQWHVGERPQQKHGAGAGRRCKKNTSKSQDKRQAPLCRKICWDQHENRSAPSIAAGGPNVYCYNRIAWARHEPGTLSLGLAENPLNLTLGPALGPWALLEQRVLWTRSGQAKKGLLGAAQGFLSSPVTS